MKTNIYKILSGILVLLLTLSLCSCGQKAATPTWQEQYDLGVRYLSEGNYEEAIIAFTVAIEIDPKRAEAYAGRGDAYVESGITGDNLLSAIADYEKAISIDSTNADTWLSLADVYLLQGDVETACRVLDDASKQLSDAEKLKDKQSMIEAGIMRVERKESGGQYSILEYNFNNLIVKETRYDEDGPILLTYVYEYDQNGNRIKEIRYRPDGTLQDISEHDAAGNQIRFSSNSATQAGEDPNNIDRMSEFDEYGREMRSTHYDINGNVEFYIIPTYDAAGNSIREDFYNPDGTLRLYSINEYDSYGNRIKSMTYNDGGSLSESETNEYDSQHTVISSEQLWYIDGHLFERNTLSRDANGQAVWYHEQYDAQGNVIASW